VGLMQSRSLEFHYQDL